MCCYTFPLRFLLFKIFSTSYCSISEATCFLFLFCACDRYSTIKLKSKLKLNHLNLPFYLNQTPDVRLLCDYDMRDAYDDYRLTFCLKLCVTFIKLKKGIQVTDVAYAIVWNWCSTYMHWTSQTTHKFTIYFPPPKCFLENSFFWDILKYFVEYLNDLHKNSFSKLLCKESYERGAEMSLL